MSTAICWRNKKVHFGRVFRLFNRIYSYYFLKPTIVLVLSKQLYNKQITISIDLFLRRRQYEDDAYQ